MSKSIRIREHLYEEIQRVADAENRPLIRQLELLLEQALGLNRTGTPTAEMATASLPSERAEPVPAAVNQSGNEGRRPTPADCGMSNRHRMRTKQNPCPRCGYPA